MNQGILEIYGMHMEGFEAFPMFQIVLIVKPDQEIVVLVNLRWHHTDFVSSVLVFVLHQLLIPLELEVLNREKNIIYI